MKIEWKQQKDQSYKGTDESGNTYRQPANQETTTVYLKDGRSGQGWTAEEALKEAQKQNHPDYNSITNQHIKGLLIQREVYYCQTSVVEELLKDQPDTLSELENFWYYRLDLSDGEFIGDYDDLQEKIAEAQENITKLEAERDELQEQEAQEDTAGKLDGLEASITALEDDLTEIMDEPDTEASEIFEWWLISDHMARKLKEKGQVIWEDYGCCWWGRQATGQAILLDHVISMIAEDMEILQGMPNSWEDRN